MCSELCKDFYVVYQLEMVAGEVESSCQLVATFFFFFFFGLTLPNYRNSGSAQPPLISTTCSAAAGQDLWNIGLAMQETCHASERLPLSLITSYNT